MIFRILREGQEANGAKKQRKKQRLHERMNARMFAHSQAQGEKEGRTLTNSSGDRSSISTGNTKKPAVTSKERITLDLKACKRSRET